VKNYDISSFLPNNWLHWNETFTFGQGIVHRFSKGKSIYYCISQLHHIFSTLWLDDFIWNLHSWMTDSPSIDQQPVIFIALIRLMIFGKICHIVGWFEIIFFYMSGGSLWVCLAVRTRQTSSLPVCLVICHHSRRYLSGADVMVTRKGNSLWSWAFVHTQNHTQKMCLRKKTSSPQSAGTHWTISSTIFGSVAILLTFSKHKFELHWTTSLRPSHRRVSTCRLQNGQGRAGNQSGLARGTIKALLWRAMGIPMST
jgi:hypothetical protein